MGKRIFRLSATEALAKGDQLLNKELSFVMVDGRVFTASLKKTDQKIFYCENMLKNLFQIKSEEVNEVIYDMISNY